MPRSASSSSTSRQDRPYRGYQRTATEITSRGNRKPAKAELMAGAVTGPVSRRPRSANATVPNGELATNQADQLQPARLRDAAGSPTWRVVMGPSRCGRWQASATSLEGVWPDLVARGDSDPRGPCLAG